MIPCFVISLERAETRRQQIGHALNTLGIAFEFVDAIDGAAGFSPSVEALINRQHHAGISEREYACALSHSMVYQRIVDEQIAHALILEDDALLTSSLATFLQMKCHELKPMFLLYHGRAYVDRFRTLELFDSVQARALNLNCSYAAAYTVNLWAAEQLLAACRPVTSLADWPMDIATLDAHITQPVLVQHSPDMTVSELAKDRLRKPKPRDRYFTWRYYQRRWIRFRSERVEAQALHECSTLVVASQPGQT